MKTRREVLKNIIVGATLLPLATRSSATKKTTVQESCFETTLDFYGQGPFYTDNPPIIQDDLLAEIDEPGQRLIVSGRVFNLSCNEFIPETIIDVWHANDAGQYDNQAYNLRGITTRSHRQDSLP
jgi:protocatechuate 3,4-dioxygenase beta subunit